MKSTRVLTSVQKEFLLQHFFTLPEYVGWHNIATRLLETGECVVAGNCGIWRGGIGNFIITSISDGYYDCIKYSFNLDYFLSSEWFKEVLSNYIDDLIEKKRTLEDQIVDFSLLTTTTSTNCK